MTYNHNSFSGGLGMPGSGFASRGKGAHIKRLSVAPPAKIPTIDENQQIKPGPTPRTSRSHMLAGLRTAPKSPTFPTSAPPTQVQHQVPQTGGGLSASRYATSQDNGSSQALPKTATGVSFPKSQQVRYNPQNGPSLYSPDQVLPPPQIQIGGEDENSCMDPQVYEDLLRTNQHLAQQQARLQQQLREVTAAAQQFQGLNVGNGPSQYQQLNGQPQMMPDMGFYSQQLQQQLQPTLTPIPGQPGTYMVYYPMTGQYGYFVDQNGQRNQQVMQTPIGHLDLSNSPPPLTPTFHAQVSPPPEESPTPASIYRNVSPPKPSHSPPQDVVALPPPSANAFRAGHRKALSLMPTDSQGPANNFDAPKTGGLKSAGFPVTPMTGTFGPGQGRAGEHPIRQPRGPPSLEELIAKPTSKVEGSKNFATRQRRRAVHNLVRAGLERRTASRNDGSVASADSMTPTSEIEIRFSSDDDIDSVGSGSGSLSGKRSLGSLRAVANGAIGSERKELRERSRERSSPNRNFTTNSLSSDEGATVGGKLVEVQSAESKSQERRKTPLLVLTSAEKRKSSIF